MTDISEFSQAILERMGQAAVRAGRDPRDVRLIAVSKGVGAGRIREAAGAGLRVFGESRVQEAASKARELGDLNIEWHMVGHLQKNKARAAVEIFELIHSVDSISLLELLERHSGACGKHQRVLVQVKLEPEDTKSGIAEDKLEGLLAAAEGMKNLRVEGLMTIPPFFEDPERSRPFYRRLRRLAERYCLDELSMGMTGDFEIAIEEGATMVRVGTAIFGERPG